MTIFQPAKDLFAHDLETNLLLRRHLEFEQFSQKSIRIRFKLIRVVVLVFLGIPFIIVKKNPKLVESIYKVGQKYKKYLPVWLKRSVKVALRILPSEKHINSSGIYELKIMHPSSMERGFGLPTSIHPEVSIIIPVHNHINTTLTLLQQFRLNTDSTTFEIIVVDDASTDSTKTALSKIRGIKVLTHEKNVGYLRATNSAIQYCEGKYICLLNNDTVPESGWLDALTRTLNDDAQIAIAGSMLLAADGSVAEVGSQIFRNHEIWNLGRWAERGSELFSFTREVEYCSAAAILVDGEFLRSLNGFDERYVPAYYEDTDLAITAWSQGRKVVYVHDSRVYHLEGVSHGKDTSQGLKAYQEVNKKKFWDKWEKTIDLPWVINEVPRYEADRDSRGIVVFIDNYVPSMNSNAGASRAYKIIEAMRQLKFHVVVIPASPGVEIWNREQLRRSGVEIYQSYDDAIDNLKMRSSRINSFWVSRVDVAEVVFPRIKSDFPGMPIYFDTVDLHHLRDERNRSLHGSSAAIYGNDIKAKELRICGEAEKVIVVAEYENEYLTKQDNALKVHTLFMPQTSGATTEASKTRDYLLFVGNFQHTPNADGVEWLIDEILPKVVDATGDPLQLRIVGAGIPESILEKIDGDKIQYLGWQESLDALYDEARIVVVPIRYGAGKKGKLAEAVMHNCPVISTSVGAEGYPLDDGSDFILANTPEDFALAISRLWSDAELATTMAKNARTKIEPEAGFEEFVKVVSQILDVVN